MDRHPSTGRVGAVDWRQGRQPTAASRSRRHAAVSGRYQDGAGRCRSHRRRCPRRDDRHGRAISRGNGRFRDGDIWRRSLTQPQRFHRGYLSRSNGRPPRPTRQLGTAARVASVVGRAARSGPARDNPPAGSGDGCGRSVECVAPRDRCHENSNRKRHTPRIWTRPRDP